MLWDLGWHWHLFQPGHSQTQPPGCRHVLSAICVETQTRLLVLVAFATSVSPYPHGTASAEHTRSRVLVGDTDSYCPAPHGGLSVLHCRSRVEVGATLSY